MFNTFAALPVVYGWGECLTNAGYLNHFISNRVSDNIYSNIMTCEDIILGKYERSFADIIQIISLFFEIFKILCSFASFAFIQVSFSMILSL